MQTQHSPIHHSTNLQILISLTKNRNLKTWQDGLHNFVILDDIMFMFDLSISALLLKSLSLFISFKVQVYCDKIISIILSKMFTSIPWTSFILQITLKCINLLYLNYTNKEMITYIWKFHLVNSNNKVLKLNMENFKMLNMKTHIFFNFLRLSFKVFCKSNIFFFKSFEIINNYML